MRGLAGQPAFTGFGGVKATLEALAIHDAMANGPAAEIIPAIATRSGPGPRVPRQAVPTAGGLQARLGAVMPARSSATAAKRRFIVCPSFMLARTIADSRAGGSRCHALDGGNFATG